MVKNVLQNSVFRQRTNLHDKPKLLIYRLCLPTGGMDFRHETRCRFSQFAPNPSKTGPRLDEVRCMSRLVIGKRLYRSEFIELASNEIISLDASAP